MGVDEDNIQATDVEMIMGNRPITIPTVHTSSSYGVEIKKTCIKRLAKGGSTNLYSVHVYNSHYILHLICDSRRGKR